MTPWTIAHQAPLSMGFSRQEYCSGLPFLSPGESSGPRNRTQVSCIAGGFLHGRRILYPLNYRKPHTYIHTYIHIFMYVGFSGGSVAKNPPANARDTGEAGLILGLGRSPGGGNNSLQYSCLGNPMDREGWQATVHGLTKSWKLLSY